MSEAVEYNNQLHSPQLQDARNERLKATLVYLTKEYRESKVKVNELRPEISSILDDIKSLQIKRKRLMKQNFSASEHLKKTHEKYWKGIQSKTRLYQVKRSQLKYYADKITMLKQKIPEIRDSIMSNM